MEAIGLNPIRLDRIGLDPIRVNAIKLGVPGAASGSDRPYIDPEVLASLVAVCICDGKSNDDPDRAVIKNLVDPDNPFIISNAAYKLNSGYGGYANDFTTFRNSSHLQVEYSNDGKSLKITSENTKDWWLISPSNGIFSSCRIKVTNCHYPIFYRYTDDGNTYKEIKISEDGIYNLPKSIINNEGVVNRCCFGSGVQRDDYTGLTIEQLPLYEGAFVTDGKDDLITSTKTVKEMLGGSNEITVVSMMLNLENEKITYTNQIRPFQNGYIRNNVISNTEGKCGIYGYKITDISDIFKNRISINDILGDRKDYGMDAGGTARIDGKFSVEGYCFNDGTIGEVSQVAWYWTFISNKALTTDQINQVISYFNLDKHVKPDIIYDTIRQGITNENHASFNDELVDFSGNGHNMKIYNSAWKLGSGIGKYEADYSTWTKVDGVITTPTGFKIVGQISSTWWLLFLYNTIVPAHKIKVSGIPAGGKLVYDVTTNLENGINELPEMEATSARGFTINLGNTQFSDWIGLSVEQIPDYEGALVSDGIDDYGKVENLPIYKDYTVVADREMLGVTDGGVFLKGEDFREGAFSFDYTNESSSFGGSVQKLVDTKRLISYQSKYVNNGININAGTATDTDKLWLAKLGNSNRYSKLALWSFLLFPYTLSEFLLERQLKRYKLGTLYPDMIEWRPIAKSNIPYKKIDYFIKRSGAYVRLNPGDYFQSTEDIIVRVTPIRDWQLDVVSSIKVNGKNEVISVNSSYAQTAPIHIDKSPQKIDITIDEYIRYEDIVQPYPAIINLKQDGKTITWGDKLKVGSDIVFAGSANLLPELYTVSETRYNGVTLYPNTIIKVEKSMVFDNARTYLKANEPNCILSPNRLRIPNSSYKILGYIPDLTGKGNHGIINNSTYAGMSGANGYKYNWNTWRISKSGITCTVTDSRLHITSLKEQYNPNQALFESRTPANTGDKADFKVNITGITSDMRCTFNNAGAVVKELVNGVNEISVDLVAGWYGFMITALDGSVIGDCDITIQQIGQYESSFCLDGVDDFVTIPTLAHGGKQVLMKVNLQSYDRYLYDQRNSWSQYLAIVSAGKTIAYEYSNKGGKTYIDGILNEHIIDKDLLNITHNITATNANIGVQYAPNIGTSFARGNFAQMALFDFMLFPDISSEEEIKELNEVMGIENNIEVS